jgi:lipoate-protein ligase B
MPYEPTAELQRSLRSAREAGAIPDTILVVEHDPVVTTGHRTEPHEVVLAAAAGLPIVPTERGGKATWHGPGQIVVYPVFNLKRHGEDVKRFVRLLEQAIIDTLAGFDIEAARNDGYPGVWTQGRKIASIGIRVTKWVSFHGIAVNVDCDLAPFSYFTPCGISDVEMTSMAKELDHKVDIAEVRERLLHQIAGEFNLGPISEVTASRLDAVAVEYPAPAVDLKPAISAETPLVAGRSVDLVGGPS